LEYKYLAGECGATPEYYTIAYNRMYMGEINYSQRVYWYYMLVSGKTQSS